MPSQSARSVWTDHTAKVLSAARSTAATERRGAAATMTDPSYWYASSSGRHRTLHRRRRDLNEAQSDLGIGDTPSSLAPSHSDFKRLRRLIVHLLGMCRFQSPLDPVCVTLSSRGASRGRVCTARHASHTNRALLEAVEVADEFNKASVMHLGGNVSALQLNMYRETSVGV